MDAKSLANKFLKISPYIAAAGTGSAIGAALDEEKRKKGALKGALIGLGSLVGGNVALKGGRAISKKIYGDKLHLAENMFKNISNTDIQSGVAKTIIDHLVEKNLIDEANAFATAFMSSGKIVDAIAVSSPKVKKIISSMPINDYHKILSKSGLITGGAQIIGSTAGLAGTAYALKNGNSSKKQ